MLDWSLLLGASWLLGQRAVVQPSSACLVLIASLWLLRRNVSRKLTIASGLLFALSFARSHRALADADHVRAAARDALGAPSRCDALARVISSPVRKGDALRWVGEFSQIHCEERRIEGHWTVRLHGGPDDLARGDEVEVIAQLGATQLFVNPDVADPRPSAARSGVVASGGALDVKLLSRGLGPGAWIDRARAVARARIDATYQPDAAPLARALVLGEEDLSDEDGEAFRKSGLAHLLAVSGTHLVVMVASVVAGLRMLLIRMEALASSSDVDRWASLAGAVLSFVYADFAGASGSAMRAAVMMAAVLGARALGRRGDAPRALGLSLLALGFTDAFAAFELSFLLSAAATSGLLVLGGPLGKLLTRALGQKLAWLSNLLGPTLAATIACAPLIAVLSPSLPLAGIVANLVAVPIGEMAALPLCLGHVLLSPLPLAERGAALAASGALLLVKHIALLSAAPAWGQLPVPAPTEAQGVVLCLGALGCWTARSGRRGAALLVTAAALLVCEGLAFQGPRAAGRLRVTSLDVGQGDATLVELPDGSSLLIDGGGFVGSPVDPGKSVLLPVLRAKRRARVDVAVLSHPHPDHFIGLASALPRLGVGEFWDTGQGEDEGAGPVYAAMLAELRTRGVPVRRPDALCNAPRRFGEALVEVLAPCPDYTPFINANDNSIVLRVSLGRRAALLVGDAEAEEEAHLVAALGERLRADVLKAGHHGSRTSTTPGFLDAVSPSLVVLSCGVRNRYGHPHPHTLATLAARNLTVARTDRGGAVVWETDGEQVWTTRGNECSPAWDPRRITQRMVMSRP